MRDAAAACEKVEADVRAIEAQRQIKDAERNARPEPKIGMSAKQVIERTNWGEPDKVNTTLTQGGKREQWVYYFDGGTGYLYFTNGRQTAIQY